jgi:hypothetical protein
MVFGIQLFAILCLFLSCDAWFHHGKFNSVVSLRKISTLRQTDVVVTRMASTGSAGGSGGVQLDVKIGILLLLIRFSLDFLIN